MTSNGGGRTRVPIWLVASILATALLSLWSISYRYRVEEHNKAVSIALEYETVEAFAAGQGRTVDQALADLKSQGLRSIVLTEETVSDLVNSGRAVIDASGLRLTSPDPALTTRIQRAMTLRFPGATRSGIRDASLSAAELRILTIGLNPEQARLARRSGLTIIARLSNPAGVTSEYVRGTLDWAHELGASVFLPIGDQVLGRREAMKDLADELDRLGMLYASPEFAKIGGDANVLDLAPNRIVRLHSAQSAELDKLKPPEAIERYSLAARERGMRILLLRPLSYAAQNPLTSLGGFVRAVAQDCTRQGLVLGEAHPYDDSNVPNWLKLLIGLSIIPSAAFAGFAFIASRRWRIAGFVVVAAIGLSAISHSGRPFTALLAAIAFPTTAFLALDHLTDPERRRPFRSMSAPWLGVVGGFFAVSLISLTGGLAVAGLLNSLPYFIRAEQFEGVKLAVFLPILLVALYFLMRSVDLRRLARNPMTWGAAILALVILAALAFMSSRTGNDNPAGVSDVELKMRFLLDRVLIVRPRTKEFLVGHPLLILGIGWLLASRRQNVTDLGDEPSMQPALVGAGLRSMPDDPPVVGSAPPRPTAVWAALALAGGAIGQTDIVNTMCHIHTPVTLSLIRIGVGMLAGCIIGLAVWAIVKRGLAAGES